MDESKLHNIEDINPDNIIYNDIKSKEDKTAIVMKYRDKSILSDIIFQTPSLINLKIINKRKNYFELIVPLYGKKQNKIKNFIKFAEKLDKKIVYDAQINSSAWFTDKNTYRYKKTIKKNIHSEIDLDEIKTKKDCGNINLNNGFLKVKIIGHEYDHEIKDKSKSFSTTLMYEKKNITISEIPDKSWVKLIVQLDSLYINNNNFEIFVKPILINFTDFEKLSDNNKISLNSLPDC